MDGEEIVTKIRAIKESRFADADSFPYPNENYYPHDHHGTDSNWGGTCRYFLSHRIIIF